MSRVRGGYSVTVNTNGEKSRLQEHFIFLRASLVFSTMETDTWRKVNVKTGLFQ